MPQMQIAAQFFEPKVLFHANINSENTCKIVGKIHFLKSGL